MGFVTAAQTDVERLLSQLEVRGSKDKLQKDHEDKDRILLKFR